MIFGLSPTAVDIIRLAPMTFRLTGSRYFGTDRPDSDWDFFVQDAENTADFLTKNGFRLDSVSYKEDSNITRVFKKDNVHVQLVQDEKKKILLQCLLKPVFQFLSLDLNRGTKTLNRAIWQAAYDCYEAGAEYR